MVRTAKENPESKRRLMDAAEKLILSKGFNATSVDEICARARLTKGCFFHYFKSKDDLLREVLARFCNDQKGRIETDICCGRTQDPLQRVYAHIACAVEMSKGCVKGKGCLIGVLSQEVSDTHPKIREMCARGFNEWMMIFRSDLEEARRKYAPRAAIDSKSLAEHFIAVVEGSQILAKARQDAKIVEKNLGHFQKYLESILVRKK